MKMIINKYIKPTKLAMIFGAMVALASCASDFTSPTSPAGTTIADVANDNDSLKAFVAALTRTGLYPNFDNINGGQYTMFAPTNYSFVKFLRSNGISIGKVTIASAGDSAVKAINNKVTYTSSGVSISGAGSGSKSLVSYLNYHVVSAALPTSAITGAQGFVTWNGARLSVSKITGGTYTYVLNANAGANGANIIDADKTAANGVLHIIDAVMSPISSASAMAFLGLSINYGVSPAVISGGTSTDGNKNNYNLLAAAIRVTGLTTTLLPNASPLPDFTILAPKDSAFLAQYSWVDEPTAYTAITTLNETTTPKLSELTSALKNLVVSGRYVSPDLAAGVTLTSLGGGQVAASTSGSKILLNAGGTIWIRSKDNLTNAGIVHGTNGFLP